MVKKILILDSGPIINFSMNSLLYLFEKIDSIPEMDIVMTNFVRKEVVDYPLNIKRFELDALRVNELIQKKIIKTPTDFGISNEEISKLTQKIISVINLTLKANNQYIKIVSDAEVSCLALSLLLNKKNIETMIGIDERTTRILFEKSENLEELMSKKLKTRVVIDNNEFKKFGIFRFIRSSEIVYAAYKKNLTLIKGKRALEALIFATKFKGSSISFEEIDKLKRL
ncbi:hypothetical protein AUJ84_01775 [Candidatus Pacearchaeota archaeon CG1_02_32_132]|nr:MAG: hypothetical protein AUJ84_01775 [Candidatus Pacearchaeota archaeon CG1_02_32_132]